MVQASPDHKILLLFFISFVEIKTSAASLTLQDTQRGVDENSA